MSKLDILTIEVIRSGASILDANGDTFCDDLWEVADQLEKYFQVDTMVVVDGRHRTAAFDMLQEAV